MNLPDSEVIARIEGRIEPIILDCTCPRGVLECCGQCPGTTSEPCCLPEDAEDSK